MISFKLETLDFIETCAECQAKTKLVFLYDIYYIPETDNTKVCVDCLDLAAEKQFQSTLEKG